MPFLTQVKPLWDRSTLTLAELAEQCHISESSASRYMSGKIVPPADIAERILQVLSADIVTEPTPETQPQAAVPPVLQIWEVYKEEIDILQANHANHLTHLQHSHDSHISSLHTSYSDQIANLKRDRAVLFFAMLAILGLLVYFILTCL